jgi:hypothetical protein
MIVIHFLIMPSSVIDQSLIGCRKKSAKMYSHRGNAEIFEGYSCLVEVSKVNSPR